MLLKLIKSDLSSANLCSKKLYDESRSNNYKLFKMIKKAIVSLRKKLKLVHRRSEPEIKISLDLDPLADLVNLGCGKTYHSDWDNYDLVPAHDSVRPLDLLKKFPLGNSCYDFCYSSHVLEHMPRGHASVFLKEIYRILRPDGVVRIVVPDLEGIVRRYLVELEAAATGDESALPRHQWMTIELLDQLTRTFSGGFMGRLWYSRPLLSRELIEERLGGEASHWLSKADTNFLTGEPPLTNEQVFQVGSTSPADEVKFRNQGEIHRWMYDRISLCALLVEAGFHDIKVCSATESRIPEFNSYSLDVDDHGAVRKPDSLFMEGVK